MKRTFGILSCALASALAAGPAPAQTRAVDGPPPVREGDKAADPKLAAAVAAIQKVYDGLDAFKVAFEQTDELATLGKAKTASGSFYFRKPGKMRWEYEKPEKEKKLIVVDGETAWIHLPSEKQVYKQRVDEAFQSQTLITFLGGLGRLEDAFAIRFAGGADSGEGPLRLHLTPKADAGAPEMDLAVRRDTHEVAQVAFEDPFGNATRIDFGPVERDARIAPALFAFTPPPDATVTVADRAAR